MLFLHVFLLNESKQIRTIGSLAQFPHLGLGLRLCFPQYSAAFSIAISLDKSACVMRFIESHFYIAVFVFLCNINICLLMKKRLNSVEIVTCINFFLDFPL